MIIKASQRGGANKLASHLLNANDNEHVRVHEVSGFVADDLAEALREAYVISRGSRCTQFLFSVSLSPPPNTDVAFEVFEDAASRIADRMGLAKQPHVLVFHEKHGRRHAHAVWSRIDPETMKAINLPFFKNKLMEIAREIHLEQGWMLPDGLRDRQNRNPLNFTLAEWQQAKRHGDDPRQSKLALQECWQTTKDKPGFIQAIERQGYYLAQGDRRGFVVVDWRGQVHALPRQLGLKTAEVKAKLGAHEDLPTVTETIASIDRQLVGALQAHMVTLNESHQKKLQPLMQEKATMLSRHKREREQRQAEQDARWRVEQLRRQDRQRQGLLGLMDRMTGRYQRVRKDNEIEALMAMRRNREERDQVALGQIRERSFLQRGLKAAEREHEQDKTALREAVFSRVPPEQISRLHEVFLEQKIEATMEYSPDF